MGGGRGGFSGRGAGRVRMMEENRMDVLKPTMAEKGKRDVRRENDGPCARRGTQGWRVGDVWHVPDSSWLFSPSSRHLSYFPQLYSPALGIG